MCMERLAFTDDRLQVRSLPEFQVHPADTCRMASTRILSSPSLLSAIFHYLEPPTLGKSDGPVAEELKEQCKELRDTLACAARSCRALSEPALAVLWKDIDNVTYLLKVLRHYRPCFPGSIIYVSSLLHRAQDSFTSQY